THPLHTLRSIAPSRRRLVIQWSHQNLPTIETDELHKYCLSEYKSREHPLVLTSGINRPQHCGNREKQERIDIHRRSGGFAGVIDACCEQSRKRNDAEYEENKRLAAGTEYRDPTSAQHAKIRCEKQRDLSD